MSTKTKRRPPVRALPPPVQQPPQRRALPKVLLIAGGAVAAVALAVVLAVTLSGGSSSTSVSVLPGAADVQRLFKGIPQDGNTLGSPTAAVTMVEYVDLQCPYCREFETVVL